MRILHWSESFHPRIGGAEVFAHHLARHQVSQGHECLVMTGSLPGQAPTESLDGIEIRRLPFQPTLIERRLPRIIGLHHQLEDLIASFAPDIVHLHTSQASAFFFTRIPRARRPPTVFTAHDGFLEDIHTRESLLGLILSRVERIVAPSDHVCRAYRNAFPHAASKLVHIAGSLPAPRLQACSPVAPPQARRLLALGRLVPEKGFDILVHALAIVRGALPQLQTRIAGDGPEAGRLKALTRTLGLSDRVSFSGWIPPEMVASAMRDACSVVVPSRWQEPFGLVALQAMQVGTPVIAARVGGLPEIVEDGLCGMLVAPDDPEALAAAIIALLGNPESLGAFSRQAIARAESAFSWESCTHDYHALYRTLSKPQSATKTVDDPSEEPRHRHP